MGDPVSDALISKVTDEVVDSLWRQINYLRHYKAHIHDLGNQLERLIAEKQSMLLSVDEAKRNGEDIEDIVTVWLKNADEAIEAAEKILKENDAANERCFTGFLPNLKTRFEFSRKAKKETSVVTEVLQQRNLIHKISHRPDVQELEPVKRYEALESRTEILKEIVGALKNVDVNLIGVYGLPGVGKTTLVKQQLVEQVKKEGIYKVVAVANVTRAWDLGKIQREIADWLGLKFDIDSTEVRATRLRARLKQEKKVLVVLDDIWEMIPLEKIGIPDKDDHEGCKVLMTSRSLNTLLEMGVQRHFPLQVLPEEEAWQLFKKQCDVLKNPKLQSIAVEVARRCAGLPVLLVAVAKSLRHKELVEWKDALEQLQKFDGKGMDAHVYPALELSYKFLGDDAKSLFILCAQLPDEIFNMGVLLKYAMGLNLFHECTTIKVLRNRLLKVANDLKRLCLLEDDNYGSITMHAVVRSFAASIASKQHQVFTLPYESDLQEWPAKEAFELYSAICLPYCTIPELPQILPCPKLESFILLNDDPSLIIPKNFFSAAKSLKLVDLYDVNLLPLPLSLGFLQNLRTLCLDHCDFDDISAIGALNKLQILSLVGTSIIQLPTVIRNLTGLQLLDLSECRRLRVVPPGILNRLRNLEELCIVDSFVEWGQEGQIGGRHCANLSELKVLSNLINLELHIMDAKVLPEVLVHQKLERFKILIGDDWDSDSYDEASKILKLKLHAGFELERVKALLIETEELFLNDLKGVRNVVPKLESQGFPELKHLQIENCHEMQFVVGRTRMRNIVPFTSLESLFLVNLNKLEKISYDAFAASSFKNLRELEVGNCKVLENLLSFSMFRCLVQLREINVYQCEYLKEVVSMRYEDDDVQDETIVLTPLATLTLEDLPLLEGFSTSEVASGIMSLGDEPTHLFNKKIQFPNLIDLKLSSINVEKICHDHNVGFCPFEKLTTLIVDGCGNLASLFNSSIIRNLTQLQELEICDCKSIEEVISSEGGTEEEMIFTKLIVLKMKGLQRATKFCTCSYIRCPLLELLLIENCPRLQRFVSEDVTSSGEAGQQLWPLFDEKVQLPNLKNLRILGVNGFNVIWSDELHEDSFSKLNYLEVVDAGEIIRIFPPMLLCRFVNLERLLIGACHALMEVFDIQALMDVNRERGRVAEIFQLQKLWVQYSPNLKHVWNEDPNGILDFQDLRFVDIRGCPSLKSVFPVSMARGLVHLESISIIESGVEEIVAEDQEGIADEDVFEFPELKSIFLRRLPQLESFYPKAHTSEWPALRQFHVTACPKFQQLTLSYNKVIPNLKELALNGKDLAMIREGRLSVDMFQKLKCVEFNYYDDYSRVFPFDILHIFPNMETLQVTQSKFKELFPPGLVGEEKHQRILTKLQSLELFVHPNLTTIWNEALQTPENLQITHCNCLTILAPSKASFQSLTSLSISNCKGLLSLVTSSTAKALVQLERLRVSECDKLTVIVSNDEGERVNEITFTSLEELKLDCLPSLVSFCSAHHRFEFPSLMEVVLKQCPNMEFFSKGVSDTPILESVHVTEDGKKGVWFKNISTTVSFLYRKMEGFRGMQHLQVSTFSSLKDRWLGEFPAHFFSDLRSLVVDVATVSSHAVSSSLLEYLDKLEKLDVSNCEVSEVFDLQKHQGSNGLLSNLNVFRLINLPRLRHIWNEHNPFILNFRRLEFLKVENCSSLRTIFTPSMTRSLVQLQGLEVKNCISVEEIIAVGADEAKLDDTISFPCLESIVLQSLPELSSFYLGSDILQCPSLRKVIAMDCPKIEVFTSSVDAQELIIIDDENLIFGKIKCARLREMRVDWTDSVDIIWDAELLASELFCSLKILEIQHFPEEHSVIPSFFLERSSNLEELLLTDASFEELFSKEVTTIPLRHLALSKLPWLRHLVIDETESGCSIIQHPESLQVIECPKLTVLVPSFVSFHNLKTLEVSKCHCLLNLMNSSTARTLTQLTRLKITECEMIEEIVASEEDEVEAEIVFSHLKCLELGLLPKLARFCLGNIAFNFPALVQVIVMDCPKLESFVEGEVQTPSLFSVQIAEDENEWCWDGSLNATIQKLVQ